MLAGKTAISNAMIQYAPHFLVDVLSKSIANIISATPLIKTKALCAGSHAGIIFK